jgi:sugar lactone lactonase YvrE
MMQRILPLILLTTACGGAQPPPEPAPAPAPEPPVAAADPAPAPTTPAPAAAPAEPAKPAAPAPVVSYKEGIATPESVLYDEAADRYLVSNINGKPTEIDNNGYIMELSPDGKVNKPKFIAGGTNDVKLNAPKGLALHGGILYVSDVSTVRKFDAKTGAGKGEIPIAGSTFLNDVASTADGKIYVSDSGVKVTDKGFEPTGSEAVYVIEKGKAKALTKTKDLGAPNGLLPVAGGVLAVTLTSNELYRLDDKGARQDITKLPVGGLDGLVQAGDKLLVTSWSSKTIYRGKLNDKFEPLVPNVNSPADIGYDTKRSRVLVPRFLDNVVEVYEVK